MLRRWSCSRMAMARKRGAGFPVGVKRRRCAIAIVRAGLGIVRSGTGLGDGTVSVT